MDFAEVRKQLETNEDRLVGMLGDLVSQMSISEGRRGVKECARVLVDIHEKLGFTEAEVFDTGDWANVWAFLDEGKEHTLAVYAMFDHAPVPSGWRRDPYGADVESIEEHPKVMFGHGIATKGPYMTWLAGIHALKQAGVTLPFNVACLLEGEEFVGSTNYRKMINHYKDRMGNCIGLISPSAGQAPDGSVSVNLGSKGCAYFELVASGASSGRGPLGKSVHSSAQGLVESPAWGLLEAMGLFTEKGSWGTTVLLDELNEDIYLPEGEEAELLEGIIGMFEGKDLKKVLPGVAGRGEVGRLVAEAETTREAITRLLYYPTFNINGLRSGYVDIDSPLFSLPGEAVARLDARYGPGQDGDELMAAIRKILDDNGFEDIDIENKGVHNAARASLDDPIVKGVMDAYEEAGCDMTVWPMKPAGPPLGDICSEVGAPALGGVGLGALGADRTGPDEQWGAAADQYMILETDSPDIAGFLDSAEFYARYVMAIGEHL